MSHLAQIPGVTGPVLDLLKAAGFHSVSDVTSTPVEEIVARLEQANGGGEIVPGVPDPATIEDWQRAARAVEEAERPKRQPAMAAVSPAGPGDLQQARLVTAAELKKAGISPNAVPIAKIINGEDRRGTAALPAAGATRTPAGGRTRERNAETGAERAAREERVVPRFKSMDAVQKPGPRVQRRNPGMSHHSPVTVWFAAAGALLAHLLFVAGLVGTALVYYLIHSGSATFPRAAIATPALIPISLLIFVSLATRARCRLCGQRVFVPKKCLKHVKADRSVFGYVWASALRACFLRRFRCMFCGTKIRLSRKSMRGELTPADENP